MLARGQWLCLGTKWSGQVQENPRRGIGKIGCWVGWITSGKGVKSTRSQISGQEMVSGTQREQQV